MVRDSSGRFRVFLSYSRQDGSKDADEIQAELIPHGFNVWRDVSALQVGERWWRQIVEVIDLSDAMVLVVTSGAVGSRVVFDEWSHARAVGTPVFPVAFDDAIVTRLPDWLSKVEVLRLDPAYPEHEQARARLYTQLDNPPLRRPRPFTAPHMPTHFVPREAKFEEIVSALLDPTKTRRGDLGVVVLHGGGGFGKSTIARAICHDKRVRAVFDDGVLWVQFDERTAPDDALALIQTQIGLLDPNSAPALDLVAAGAQLRQLLADRDVLLVLDDVWSHTLLPHFLSDRATFLVTTRCENVLTHLPGAPVDVEPLTQDQAAQLLSRWLPVAPQPADQERLTGLAARLGEWALLLELVGAELNALVRKRRTVSDAITHVELRLDQDVTYLDRSSEDRNSAIASSLDASTAHLTPEHRDRFVELAVFPLGTEIPFGRAAGLWSVTAGYRLMNAEDALEEMQRLALFTRYDAGARTLRIHSVIQEVIVRLAGNLLPLHQALVAAMDDHLAAGNTPTPEVDSLLPLLLYFAVRARRLDVVVEAFNEPARFALLPWSIRRAYSSVELQDLQASERMEVAGAIATALASHARTSMRAAKSYPVPWADLAKRLRNENQAEFVRYRDTFYDFAVLAGFSAGWALTAFTGLEASEACHTFLEANRDIVDFLGYLEQVGSEDTGLSGALEANVAFPSWENWKRLLRIMGLGSYISGVDTNPSRLVNKYLDSVADHKVRHRPGSNLPFHPIVFSLGGMMNGSTTKPLPSAVRVRSFEL
ncbi:hypothetical protein EHS25_001943 [Saitozyma podzolica]|uniref:TIR domain-containing protein n=1 Tax=Saitozyma podzolica TaxID=1890683 RepID=A0A427YG37_9TREE|nr:hypothetical protein EHS25_001943 [Saitozyma podzolica]